MGESLRSIETTGTVDANHQLHLDEQLPITGPISVWVLILVAEEAELGEGEWLRGAATNPAFASLADPEEDVYTPEDGRPFIAPTRP